MSRYASAGGGPIKASWEFKQMVKALHCAGIEVAWVLKPKVRSGNVLYVKLLIYSESYLHTGYFGCCLQSH